MALVLLWGILVIVFQKGSNSVTAPLLQVLLYSWYRLTEQQYQGSKQYTHLPVAPCIQPSPHQAIPLFPVPALPKQASLTSPS